VGIETGAEAGDVEKTCEWNSDSTNAMVSTKVDIIAITKKAILSLLPVFILCKLTLSKGICQLFAQLNLLESMQHE
jgi:hypothetical protein